MTIAFLLSHIPDPRYNKRIQELSKRANVHVICIRRTNMDIFPLKKIDGVHYHINDLSLPSAASLVGRSIAFIKYWKFAKEQLKIVNPNIIYSNGIDMLYIATKSCRNAKICYEVADLREYATRKSSVFSTVGIADRLMRTIEKKLGNNISLLVVTSRKFYDVYYPQFIQQDKMIELPNMPVLSAFESYTPKKNGPFTIGFVGGLRYLKQMKMLVDATESLGINVIFSGATDGDADGSFQQYCRDKPWVKFTGRYDFSKEISDIYSKLDCVYSVYDASNFNVRIALPNKLYEAVICHLPIIVAKNTYLEELVSSWGVGVGTSYDNIEELRNLLIKLKNKDEYYQSFVNNCVKHQDKIDVQRYLDHLSNRISDLCCIN